MKKVINSTYPNTDLISKALTKIDFTDTFATTNRVESLEVITRKILGKAPFWVRIMMQIRNTVVRLFGIRAEKGMPQVSPFVVGEKIAFFEIMAIDKDEVILGANDKHLNFRVSVLRENDNAVQFNVKVTTIVQYLNTFGKIYMTIVKPFHKLVVKRMVAQAYYEDATI